MSEKVGNCCKNYIVDGMRYQYGGDDDGRPYYYNETEDLYLKYVNWQSGWFLSDRLDTSSEFYYYDRTDSTSGKGDYFSLVQG